MDSSQLFGGTEECNSSESGWTMYIGSPTPSYSAGDDPHSDGGENDDDDDDDDGDDDYDASHGDDSDDSMASDASSGPSQRERLCGKGGYNHRMNCFEYSKNEDDDKYSMHKKADSRAEKQRAEQKRNGEKAESMFVARKANTHVGSNSKVRKNNCIGKRK